MLKKYRTNLSISRFCLSIMLTILFLVCFSQLFYTLSIVSDSRMSPTLKKHDIVLVEKNMRLQRFDIVLCQIGGQRMFLRIVGLPGEVISYSEDILYVNGNPLEESFLQKEQDKIDDSNQFYTEPFTLSMFGQINSIPKDEYLLLGDNRAYSNDSRYYGLINKNNIKGKMIKFVYSK